MINLKNKTIVLLTYLYLFLPIILFMMFWIKPFIGIPVSLLILFGIYLAVGNEEETIKFKLDKDDIARIAVILFIVVLLVLTSGIGASVNQYRDHLYRNAIFKMMIDEFWPVTLTFDNTTKLLTYYLGFWLPSALIGKFTSYQFALLFLQLWAIFGLLLIFYYIFEKKKKIRIWYLIVFLLFGGIDYIGFKLIGELFEPIGNRYEWWAVDYNYPSFLTSLFWVYNQVIYGWLTHLFIMRQKNNKNILFIWSTSLLNCSFPAIGMIPFAIYKGLNNIEDNKIINKFTKGVKNALTIQFGIGFVICIISALYLYGNINLIKHLAIDNRYNLISADNAFALSSIVGSSFAAYPWTTKLYSYLWFVLLEFGLYVFAIYPLNKNNSLYWLTIVVLMACPLIEVGGWIDFCMRGSIPALMSLYLFVIDALENYYENKRYALLGAILILLFISGINCKDTLMGVMGSTADNIWEKNEITAEAFPNDYVFRANNFFSSTDSIFYKYLAR